MSTDNQIEIHTPEHGYVDDTKLQFSKLLTGTSEVTLVVLVIIVGVAYMIKSAVENKAKIEHPELESETEKVIFVNQEEHDI